MLPAMWCIGCPLLLAVVVVVVVWWRQGTNKVCVPHGCGSRAQEFTGSNLKVVKIEHDSNPKLIAEYKAS